MNPHTRDSLPTSGRLFRVEEDDDYMIDVPTLLTYWWRRDGTPWTSSVYLLDVEKARWSIGMAHRGNADMLGLMNRVGLDLATWRRDPASATELPLSPTHPRR